MADSQARLTNALTSAVEEMGRRVADRPDRLRAVLLDELGSHAREHRGGVDALVAAAEAHVPTALARRRRGEDAPDDAELSQLITARDVGADEAAYAIGAWAAALRADASSVASTMAGPRSPAGPDVARPVDGSSGFVDLFGLGTADAATVMAPEKGRPPGPGEGTPPPPPGRRGPVLGWWSLAALVVLVAVVAAGASFLFASRTVSTKSVSAQTTPMPGMPGMSGSASPSSGASGSATTAAATTASASATSSAPPSAVPLTVSDTTDPDFTPVETDAAANTWQAQPVTFTSTGTYDKIQVVSQLEKHGLVNVGPDGMVDGMVLTYQPKHNGDFWDHVTIRLHDTATGAVSNDATITLHALCAPGLACHNMAPGQVMK